MYSVHELKWPLTKLFESPCDVIVKERHETIMGYKPRERVALEWFIHIIVELLVTP